MKDRISEILDRYWKGETTLKEEKELKYLLRKTGKYPELKEFFLGIETLGQVEMGATITGKSRRIQKGFILKIAAVFVGLLIAGGLFYIDYYQREQEKAYLQVMEAFALIQSNMERGTSELQIMSEFHHLNKTHELFNINQLNE
jgi:hypothetical protein